jgi:hypothetical protein
MTELTHSRINRRSAIKWLLAATAAVPLWDPRAFAADGETPTPGSGYGTDPDLMKVYKPGDLWPLTFTEEQRATAAALCDVIIPADSSGPAASAVGVQDFIDEWISAPYPLHDADRKTIVDGLAWLDAESRTRFGNDFVNLVARQKNALCADIAHSLKAKPELRQGAQFFNRFRQLTAGGYYTTPEGMKDIGYVGNVALAAFAGPPPEALRILGLT